jgi:hypothetical protein
MYALSSPNVSSAIHFVDLASLVNIPHPTKSATGRNGANGLEKDMTA